jgi:hypothetical protein
MAAQNHATSKSEFIRQQPSGMSVAEIVEKARAEGLTIEAGLVYGVRRRAKSKRRAKRAVTKGAIAGLGATADKPQQSKADFVRMHADLSPSEIVAKAKEEGVALGVGYVYNVRTSDNRAGKRSPRAPRAVARPIVVSAAKPGATAGDQVENLLKAVAAEVGLRRAISILEGERARVRALING